MKKKLKLKTWIVITEQYGAYLDIDSFDAEEGLIDFLESLSPVASSVHLVGVYRTYGKDSQLYARIDSPEFDSLPASARKQLSEIPDYRITNSNSFKHIFS